MTVELEKIEQALDLLLRAAIEDDEKPRPSSIAALSATPMRELFAEGIPTRAQAQVFSLLKQPLGSACRHGVRQLGAHLFGLVGSTDGMRHVLERVADLDPARAGRRAIIMDHAWDGIGSDADRWWS